VADVFDALTSARPYKSAWTVEDAVSYMKKCTGSHFDPEVIAQFDSCMAEILHIRDSNMEPELAQ